MVSRLVDLGKRLVAPVIRFDHARGGWLKRNVPRALQAPRIWAFYRTSNPEQVWAGVEACEGKEAMLLTVAFNKPELIELQAKSLQRYFRDPYQLIVADNSSDANVRQEVQSICRSVGATYISLPPNPARNGGDSHGLALNWVHRHVIEKAPASIAYVGLLDHDIFALRAVSYRDIIQAQRAYGHFQRWGDYRIYWPGLHFFAVDYFSQGADFRPHSFGNLSADTGAGNWHHYYSNIDIDSLRCFTLEDAWAKDINRSFQKEWGSKQEAAVTFFDRDWVHLVNGSNWAGVDMESKMEWLQAFLDLNDQ